MNCPSCGCDVSTLFASAGGHARAEALTKTERKAIAALGGLAAAKRSKRAKALTRKKRSASLKAFWAAKKAKRAE